MAANTGVNPTTGQNYGTSSARGARAGESFASDEETKAKRKADSYRAARKKNFAWKPPAKAGMDPDWDSYDPDKVTAPPSGPKLTDMKK
jgi:hypothetical protein